ncbi:MAG TPA: peptidoglycan bridge formation glycyltransferase FemA/FemB family protein [Candidatus Chromulinivoraceae bacterium]|nr:peptidoglycan bridge formation glycyltransferase FemA/FemB family protein [Candidatus Chromulinivoraceae bacterium]
MTSVDTCERQEEWDEEVLTRNGHPLQLWGWGEVKAAHNWRVSRVFVKEDDKIIGAAQLLIRKLPFPFKALVYVPRGPVAAEEVREVVLDTLAEYVKDIYGAVAISVEPDWEKMPSAKGWIQTSNTILIPRTLILDLTKTEDELLADMAKKTRQYIRKSGSESIDVRRVKNREELDGCLTIYKQTAERAGFGIHSDKYYHDIYEKMDDFSPVFAAFSEGKPIAFLWLAISQETAFELYGGMNDDGQQLRANYALKWHVVQTMKKWGIERYDFNGLLNDGVSTFKQGFASHEDMLAGSYDKPLSPLYSVWTKALPAGKKVLQKLKNR